VAAVTVLPRHGRPQGWCDLAAPALDRLRVVGSDDERADAVLERERQQLLDRQVAGHVEQAPDLARVAVGGAGRLVDDVVAALEVAVLQVREAGQPTVRLGADQAQHARLERAEPDLDVVRRRRPPLGAVDVVVLAVDIDTAACGRIPDRADDVERLAQRVDRLARRATRAAGRLDRVPERAGSEAQLEAAAGQQVQARRRAREHDGRPQRKVDHVRREPYVLRLRGDPAQQRPGVEERGLVRVVLKRDEVEPCPLGELRERDDVLRAPALRCDEGSEGEVVSVVSHYENPSNSGTARMGVW
jgi:hypothetical protein